MSPTIAADPIVEDFRLSLIWLEPIFDVVTGAAKPNSAVDFVAAEQLYASRFDGILKGSGAAAFDVPWQGRERQFFWKYYLGSGGLDQASGTQAWSHFVPLKASLPFTGRSQSYKSMSIEGFYYQHAFSLIITCRFSGKLPLTEAVDLAYSTKQGKEKFSVQQNSATAISLDLDSLAGKVLSYMRESVLGKSAKPSRSRGVFTVFTVVSANPFTEFKAGGSVHRALQTVTEWPPDPSTANLLAESEIRIPIKKTTADGSILVGRQRARAVWFPGLFSVKDKKKHSLGCYHRNQCFSAMHVESLCAFVRCTLEMITTGTPFYKLKPPHRASAMDAKDRLEELYLADSQTQNTYRTSSIRKQIEQNDLKQVNDLRRIINPACQDLPPSQKSSSGSAAALLSTPTPPPPGSTPTKPQG
jgi:hypothetical protein